MDLGHRLAMIVNHELKLRARSEKPGLLGRCSSGYIAGRDWDESYMCGAAAVDAAMVGHSGKMISLLRSPGMQYEAVTGLVDLDDVAQRERPFPAEWRRAAGAGISPDFCAWLAPLTGGLDAHGELEQHIVTPLRSNGREA